MGFPDQIVRTVELAHPPAKVWVPDQWRDIS